MLTVWCVFVGDKYDVQYVYRLKKMIAANLHVPYQFKCISDRPIPVVNTVPAVPGMQGWWQKLALFKYAQGPSLYFDLDTVITGPLATLLPYTESQLAMPKNWSQSGHGGWQSSAMAWNGAERRPFMAFDDVAPTRLWGDQEFITEVIGDEVTEIESGLICSYKYHCREGLPAKAVAVTFHGKPDYHEVSDPWVRERAFERPNRIYSKSAVSA